MLNSSLITLNIVNSYRKLIDRDQCLPSTTARALMTFQATFGVFPKILACGKTSCATVELLLSSRKELIPCEDKISPPQFSSLILIDRSTDITSPLLTPTSYNALLERFLDAKWNKVPVKQAEKPDKTVHLTNDPFFNELRNVHVKHAARIISQKLRTLKSSFDESHGNTFWKDTFQKVF
ncbi:unnamed protein product [Oikopleura dioica]|nr:unnamed protein product [Oikopleura dioica]